MKKLKISCILLCLLVFPNFLISQIIQIGSGSSVNSVTQASPVNIYYRRTVSQMVYTKAELNTAGKVYGDTIREIGFFVFAKPLYVIPGYTIKMKHTNQTDVNSSLGAGGWTTVKNGFTHSPITGEWNMIKLDVPFVWNGTNNLAVEICWSQVQPGWNSSGQCSIFNTSNGYRYSRTDNAGSSCGNNPATKVNYKPQVRLKFKDYTSWIGIVNTDWFNPLNWDAGVPSFEYSAQILSTAPNMPLINNINASCLNLKIDSSALLSVEAGYDISVFGNMNIEGVLNSDSASVTFMGRKTSLLNVMGTQQFYDLLIKNPAGVILNSGQISIRNSLQLIAGKFNTGNACTILSDSINTARISEIKNACTYVLTMNDSWGDGWNGGFISAYINGILEGKYYAKSSQTIDTLYVPDGNMFSLVYTSGVYENENSYTLKDPSGNIIFTQNAPPQTGSVYTGTSSCNFSNPISGTITMQRYIDAGSTNWRFLTVSTQGATINDWKDDFIMSGFPGSHFPNWPSPGNPWSSVFYYDETVTGNNNNGFYKPSNVTNNINSGQGLWVWCGDTIIGTQPFTIDITGNAITGTVNLPVSHTNTGWPDDDGWNMLGNPYPCTIDWDDADWIKSNINDAIYIWNPDLQQYSSYVAGVGTNGGSNHIASGQAFWVKAAASLPQLISNEKIKVNQDASFIKQSLPNGVVKITVNHLNKKDETVIAFNSEATPLYDIGFDAYKLSSVEWNVPYIASVNNNLDLSINSLDSLKEDVHIPLKVIVNQSGNSFLKVYGIQSLKNIHCVFLEDLFTGIQHNLMLLDSVPCYLYDTTLSARFILHIGVEPNVEKISPSCYNSNNGSLVITGQGAGPFDVTWTDLSQNILKSTVGVMSADTLTNISAGSYIAFLTNNGYCGLYTDTLILQNPLQVIASFNTLTDTFYLSSGADVQFNNTSANAISYNWEFGDGNTSFQYSPFYTYSIEGEYAVKLISENANMCSDTFQKSIYVIDSPLFVNNKNIYSDTKVYSNGESIVLEINNIHKKEVIVNVSNILGQTFFEKKYKINNSELNVAIPLESIDGSIVFVSVYFENNKLHSFKVPILR